MSTRIQIPTHADPREFWSGGTYELNLSYDTLRDNQWSRLLESFWSIDGVFGPYEDRYTPGQAEPARTKIRYPAPTDTYSQYGIVSVDEVHLGFEVLATRSIFEGFSVHLPAGMVVTTSALENPKVAARVREAVEDAYRFVALRMYEAMPFVIGSFDFNGECYLVDELAADAAAREKFFLSGNCFIQDTALRKLGRDPDNFEQVANGLRWLPAGRGE
ncbi:MAG: hypothetical protein BroJett018_43240 [Chloroflexota bacterium]|nr:hypothetical protein [Chloroflexota bacterium]NOG65609.1 hypothetical protein [Chloroflexota bacterium]GIK66530.1 MAG: hypothetical protein BroJett018_43240 [Chloroflexota bacterium]